MLHQDTEVQPDRRNRLKKRLRRIYKGWMYIRLTTVHRTKIYIYLSFIYLIYFYTRVRARERRQYSTLPDDNRQGVPENRAGSF